VSFGDTNIGEYQRSKLEGNDGSERLHFCAIYGTLRQKRKQR
jgi:hypothetical protein